MPPQNPNPRTPEDDSLFQGRNWFSRKIIAFINSWTPRCREVTRLISGGMDRPLPLHTRIQMRAHFLTCCYCEHYKENLGYLREVIRCSPWEKDEPSAEFLPSEAKRRLKEVLRGELDRS
jgi:hypothetical protein